MRISTLLNSVGLVEVDEKYFSVLLNEYNGAYVLYVVDLETLQVNNQGAFSLTAKYELVPVREFLFSNHREMYNKLLSDITVDTQRSDSAYELHATNMAESVTSSANYYTTGTSTYNSVWYVDSEYNYIGEFNNAV